MQAIRLRNTTKARYATMLLFVYVLTMPFLTMSSYGLVTLLSQENQKGNEDLYASVKNYHTTAFRNFSDENDKSSVNSIRQFFSQHWNKFSTGSIFLLASIDESSAAVLIEYKIIGFFFPFHFFW